MSDSWKADRIGAALNGNNPTVMAEMASGWAVIGDTQFLPGYSVMLSRHAEAKKLSDLSRAERLQFLADTDLLAQAVEAGCRSLDTEFRRTNIDILGNSDPFVHAHVFPRYEWEPEHLVGRPVWLYPPSSWTDSELQLSPRFDPLRAAITRELNSLLELDPTNGS
jgi:diadenosine tetraphosphate (Ap4A) HIT family hydrolase